MPVVSKSTAKRRTLLQRGLALVAGAAGLGLAGRKVEAALAPKPAATNGPLTLYWRRRQSPAGASSGMAANGQRVMRFGELLDGPQGRTIGQLQVNGFFQETPFGSHLATAGNVEFHTLRLADGMLFGIGGSAGDAERTYAVLGGTGRFAGARGSYVEKPHAVAGSAEVVELVVSLTS